MKSIAGTMLITRLPVLGLFLVLGAMSQVVVHGAASATGEGDALDRGFANPPNSARLRAYWWWLNGNVTESAITRDLEEMKAKGFGGALICDAGGAQQDGNDPVPHGPTFFTPEWRELYKHTLREADRLGLEMSLNIQSGWNLGGPMVRAEDAAKKLTWSEARITGPAKYEHALPVPKSRDSFYRDIAVVAYRILPEGSATNGAPGTARDAEGCRPLQNWEQKALHRPLHFSAPDTAPLFAEAEAVPGEADAQAEHVLDLTTNLSPEGVLRWDVPEGNWQVLRLGCTIGDHSRVSTCSDGWQGYAVDVLDAAAFNRYWDAVVEPLIADAGPLAGRVLKYLHTDSWEVEPLNWGPTLIPEFRKRRGYNLLPFFPVLTGRIVASRAASNRFLHDFRKTVGELAIDNHFRIFRDRAHQRGLQIHPESGGPHAVPIDAQRCLGMNDAPMSEFWAWSWRHRVGESNRFFVKQPASAAHTYGRRLVLAEGFTTIGPHWQETLWDNLKPTFDRAACEGLNLLVWHAFVCSPAEMGLPGQQYFAGAHFNPNTTWWSKSAPFLAYINRCQFLLQQGLFVADACYYYGDHVPNFAQLKRSDPARVLPGYDYDVVTEEIILQRMSVRDGRIVLPDGMSYRVLVLPDRTGISLAVLEKVREMVRAGATVLGPKPSQTWSLSGFPECDAAVRKIADELWGNGDRKASGRRLLGRVISGKTAREVLADDGVKPDFECRIKGSAAPGATTSAGNGLPGLTNAWGDFRAAASTDGRGPLPLLDYIHRSTGEAEIYFLASRSNAWFVADCTFRAAGNVPEIWDPVSGKTRPAAAWSWNETQTTLPLEFAPYGSVFIVFRRPQGGGFLPSSHRNFSAYSAVHELSGPWTIEFDPTWGGPESVVFEALTNWTQRPEEGIKYYSGTATYLKTFDLPESLRQRGRHLALDLGEVANLAEVHLNGKNLGIVWAMPFRLDVTDAIKPAGNTLQVEVVNFWPNRIIGDQFLAPEKRFTQTNIRKLTKETPLTDSGLLGPVRILAEER
ncbi:MAG TPA: glycosyl hydrolase [Verrucomicrobiota bacterium]|nr:glycosyl hydrolase [Verrucomicrobiota bacterium]HQL79541.1 glycosyl hydrolase [Verrucomicrobiota bacterium]